MRRSFGQVRVDGNTGKALRRLVGINFSLGGNRVKLELASRRVEVTVGWAGPLEAACPQCGQLSGLYDLREERVW